jgi:hypothetical protein
LTEARQERSSPRAIVRSSPASAMISVSSSGSLSGPMSELGQTLPKWAVRVMSASLIGRLGSSAFRLSTTTVSMSLAGSCFSSESAPRPFHHGIRRRGGTIFTAALPSDERQVQADIRTHLIHRPARDIFPRLGGIRVFSYRIWLPASLMLLRPLGSTGTRCRQPRCGA